MKKESTKEPTWDKIGKAIGTKMEQECKDDKRKTWQIKECMPRPGCGGGGAFYGLGFIGALVYYVSTATSLWGGVIGFLKALVWPAFLVYELMKFLGM
jgi:hypothetical protein